MIYHPWRSIRMLPKWSVVYRDLGGSATGYTHRPARTIVIDKGLGQVERRCTLAHELEHLHAGHRGCQPSLIERRIRDACARRLLPIEHVIHGMQWTQDVSEFADYVWVDLDTATTRLDNLDTTERAVLDAALVGNEKTA